MELTPVIRIEDEGIYGCGNGYVVFGIELPLYDQLLQRAEAQGLTIEQFINQKLSEDNKCASNKQL